MSLLHEFKDFKAEIKQFLSEFKDKIPTDEEKTKYTQLVRSKKVIKKTKKKCE